MANEATLTISNYGLLLCGFVVIPLLTLRIRNWPLIGIYLSFQLASVMESVLADAPHLFQTSPRMADAHLLLAGLGVAALYQTRRPLLHYLGLFLVGLGIVLQSGNLVLVVLLQVLSVLAVRSYWAKSGIVHTLHESNKDH
jgi:uncharacterized membrane protein YgdD (TMEM256/DUF423 family)